MERIVRKEGFSQELVILGVEQPYSQMEVAMLQSNQIPHLLTIRIQTMNEETSYLYDISGYCNLRQFYENKELQPEQVKHILTEIIQAMEEIKEYLLSGNRLLFTEDDIYMEQDGCGMKFCYVPGYEGDFGENLCHLVEFFMNHIDHKAEDSVVFIYGLYKMVKEERVSITILKDFLKKHEKNEHMVQAITANKSIETKIEDRMEYKGSLSESKEQSVSDIWDKVDEMEHKSRQLALKICRGIQVTSVLFLAILVGYMVVYYGLGTTEGTELKQDLAMMCGGGLAFMGATIFRRKKKKEHVEQDEKSWKGSTLLQKEEWKGNPTTVLVTQQTDAPRNPVLVPVKKRSRKCIEITKNPTVIGSLREGVDEVIEDASVSRIHASIEMECEESYLTDLQSTNGTKINGNLMISGSPMLLRDGDKVMFGRVEYEFRYGFIAR